MNQRSMTVLARPAIKHSRSTASSNDLRKCRGVVLVADEDAHLRSALTVELQDRGFTVREAATGEEVLDQLSSDISIAVVDLDLTQKESLRFLSDIQRFFPSMQVIVTSPSDEEGLSDKARTSGATEFITKPYVTTMLASQIEQLRYDSLIAEEDQQIESINIQPAPPKSSLATQVGVHSEQIERIAAIDSTVMIGGESGTGKTTIARLIHESGPRANRPFVAVNCASLPRDLIEAELFGHSRGAFTGAVKDRPGRAEIADGGTLFLDEIGDLPIELQPKLLTFLQDRTIQRIGSNVSKTVDVRLIVATHQDLRTMCNERRFREDLFYRLNVLNINVAPLRDRIDEVPGLIASILGRISDARRSGSIRIDDDAIAILQNYTWPGNIRELENALERASAFCSDGCIRAIDLDLNRVSERTLPSVDSSTPSYKMRLGSTLAEIERQAIIETIKFCDGNKALTARTLGISEKSIYNKMKRLEIER